VKGIISGCELKVTDHDTGTNGKLAITNVGEFILKLQSSIQIKIGSCCFCVN
jgi:hypothetical protein